MRTLSRQEAVELSNVKFGTVRGADVYVDRVESKGVVLIECYDIYDTRHYRYPKWNGKISSIPSFLWKKITGATGAFAGSTEEAVAFIDDVAEMRHVAQLILYNGLLEGVKEWKNEESFRKKITCCLLDPKRVEELRLDNKRLEVLVKVLDEKEEPASPTVSSAVGCPSLFLPDGEILTVGCEQYWRLRKGVGTNECKMSFNGMSADNLATWSAVGAASLLPDTVRAVPRLTDDERVVASPALLAVDSFLEKYNALVEEYGICKAAVVNEATTLVSQHDSTRWPAIERQKIETVEKPSAVTDGPFRKIRAIRTENKSEESGS